MSKLWRIAGYEVRRNVLKGSSLITLLSVPLMMALNIGAGFLLETLNDENRPVGYVDLAGVLAEAIPAPGGSGFDAPVALVAFSTEAEARTALETGRLQAYYLLPVDYAVTRHVWLVYTRPPGENATRQFYDFLQINLLADQPREIAYRAAAGTEVTVRSLDGRRTVPAGGPTFGLLMPLLITMALLALLLLSAGYLLSAFADEKENRTIEILTTSASPGQIVGGKVLGIVAIGLILVTVWSAVGALAVFVAGRAGISWFQELEMDWTIVLAAAAIAVPAYVLAAALMTVVGTSVPSAQEGQWLSILFVALHLSPFYLGWAILNQPHSPTAVALSLLPFTSLTTVTLRSLFAVVPAGQVAAAVLIQALCAGGAVWLAGRVLRLGMLRYGRRLSWRALVKAGDRS